MRRPLIVLAAGFVLGEVLALQYENAVFPGLLWWLCAAAGLLGVLFYWIRRTDPVDRKQGSGAGKRALLLFFVLVLPGLSIGYGRGNQERNRLDREEGRAGELTGTRLAVRGRIVKVELGSGSISLLLEDAQATAGRKTAAFGRVAVYVAGDDGLDGPAGNPGVRFLPGMEVEVRGKLEQVEAPRNPGEFDFRVYYRSKGTACRMFGETVKIIDDDFVPYQTLLMEFRDYCAGILDRICLAGDASVFKAVLLGDTSGMEPEVRTMYQRHGISHLLAVSGQHLAIIGGGIYLVMRKSGLGYGKAGAFSAVLVISYGIMTGSSGSAIRAVIMVLCLWLAAVCGRSYDTLSGLGLASLLLLWNAPYLLFQSGFQLSFGAVLAIGGLGSWLKDGLGVEKGWQNTILISICVQIVITPVVLYHYYQHPLYGIFLNLLVIPLISVLMYSGLLGIALGSFWIGGGTAAVGAGHYVLRIYEGLCGLVERLPGYCLVMGRPSWGQFAAYAAGTAGMLYALVWWRAGGRGKITGKAGGCGKIAGMAERCRKITGAQYRGRRPAAETSGRGADVGRGRNASWILAVACIYGLCFMFLFQPAAKGLGITVMDVGQGDGILMHTGRSAILVDGGSSSEKKLGSKTLEPCLKSMGISEIEYALVSHGDSDHISGLMYLLEESQDIAIKNLVLPAPGQGQEIYDRLGRAAEKSGSRVLYMNPGDTVRTGELSLTCLYAGGTTIKENDRNTHSLVICADYKNFHMLFTGDMGTEQERELVELARENEDVEQLQKAHIDHVQVLKTAHHGSNTSSSKEFLERLNVVLAVISYGRGNSYGHPSEDVVERMKKRRIRVMETGTGGAVILWTDGSRLDCRYYR